MEDSWFLPFASSFHTLLSPFSNSLSSMLDLQTTYPPVLSFLLYLYPFFQIHSEKHQSQINARIDLFCSHIQHSWNDESHYKFWPQMPRGQSSTLQYPSLPWVPPFTSVTVPKFPTLLTTHTTPPTHPELSLRKSGPLSGTSWTYNLPTSAILHPRVSNVMLLCPFDFGTCHAPPRKGGNRKEKKKASYWVPIKMQVICYLLKEASPRHFSLVPSQD